MASLFNTLADELLLKIVDEVTPDHLEAFVLTSRRLHRIASARLKEHRDLFKKYRNIFLISNHVKHSLELILDVASHPRARYYPRHAKIEPLLFPRCDLSDDQFERLNRFGQIMCLLPHEKPVEIVKSSLRSSSFYVLSLDILLAVCFSILPSLRSIQVGGTTDYYREVPYAIKTMKRLNGGHCQQFGVQHICKLSKISLLSTEWNQCLGAGWLALLVTIPSLGTLEIVGFCDFDVFPAVCGEKSSSIDKLILRCCDIAEEGLSNLFRFVRPLTRFGYLHLDSCKTASRPMCQRTGGRNDDCHRVLVPLMQYARNTLEMLSLDVPYNLCSTQELEAIRSFKKLKIFALSHGILSHNQSKRCDLSELLPAQIEELQLFTNKDMQMAWIPQSLRDRWLGGLRMLSSLRKLTLTLPFFLHWTGMPPTSINFLPPQMEELGIITRHRELHKLLPCFKLIQATYTRTIRNFIVRYDIVDGYNSPCPKLVEEMFQTISTENDEIRLLYERMRNRLLELDDQNPHQQLDQMTMIGQFDNS